VIEREGERGITRCVSSSAQSGPTKSASAASFILPPTSFPGAKRVGEARFASWIAGVTGRAPRAGTLAAAGGLLASTLA
jgi:hypothetical protein